ncbi:myricetin O-methyltransferase-like [Arachis ipaensis]|uniref:myricetin O-methyltransferase-like n=1 Tax=Arachis ipaensis TaxID=130454 RepID=UPI0007AFAD17|nr:myricetin O-methyltransferase-like [Arachis ipaensis]XP_025664867.1 myricetin O-methyltransferase-like [Arachis hypogaea]
MFKIALKECRHVFENLGSIVDVGGVSKLIHQEFSQLKCTVFDQSEVVGNLKGDGNLNFVAGDMFKSIPSADAVLRRRQRILDFVFMALLERRRDWKHYEAEELDKTKQGQCKTERGAVVKDNGFDKVILEVDAMDVWKWITSQETINSYASFSMFIELEYMLIPR